MGDKDIQNSFLGRGFKFPVQVDQATGRFEMVSGVEDIRESIGIILNTRPGERLMRPEFGCRIHDYLFESMNYTVMTAMAETVREALSVWEPRICNVEVKADTQRLSEGIVDMHISYVVRSTNNPYNLVYPFYFRGERI